MTTATRDGRLTHSRIRCAQQCLRKHYLQYEHGIRPEVTDENLRIGSAFHRGLELMGEMPEDEAILEALSDYDEGPPAGFTDEEAHDWWVERETVARLLTAHAWRWREMNAEMEVLATERTFEIPVVNPRTGYPSRTWTLAGKRDKIVRLPDGRTAILEYKTTSSEIDPDSDYWQRLRMDSQISLYWLAAEDEGYEIDTVLYDVTHKPGIRPRQIPLRDEEGRKIVLNGDGERAYKTKTEPVLDEDGNKIVLDKDGERVFNQDGSPRQTGSSKHSYEVKKRETQGEPYQGASAREDFELQTRPETPEEYAERLTDRITEDPDRYFARREIPRLEADLEEARYELWQWGKILRECQRNGRWPRNTDACNGFGRCVCWDLCTTDFDPETDPAPAPEGWVRVDDIHQELTE